MKKLAIVISLVLFSSTVFGGKPWATYFGFNGQDIGTGIITDSFGNVYVTGSTNSITGLATIGAYQTVYGGGTDDVFLLKFNSTGVLIWSTYYGGSGSDKPAGITIDKNGLIVIAGTTNSTTGISTPGAFQSTFGGGSGDAFIAKFNSTGSCIWGTYYGGTNLDLGQGLIADSIGNYYITGYTNSTTSISTLGSYQSAFGGGSGDAFIVKFNSSGTRLWGTYYGGNNNDNPTGINVDKFLNVTITGLTSSTTGISSAGAYQTSFGGGSSDAFIVKLNSSGIRQWATYYGGGSSDVGQSITSDLDGNIFICGNTTSISGIATAGAFQTTYAGGTCDAFIVKLNSAGFRQWGTYYGGLGDDYTLKIKTDSSGNCLITGYTSSISGISTTGAYQATFAGGANDAFIAKLTTSGARQWGTYYGGSNDDNLFDIYLNQINNVFITGATSSSNGIASNGAFQIINGGGNRDALVGVFTQDGNLVDTISNNSIVGSQAICAGITPQTIYGSNPLGGIVGNTWYKWLISTIDSNIGFNNITGNSDFVSFTPNALNTTSWFRRVVISSNKYDTSSAIKISILPKPALGISASPGNNLCIGTVLTLTGTGASNYNWSGSVINGTAFLPSLTSSTLLDIKINKITGGYPVKVAISDIDGDNKKDIIVINQDSFTVSIFKNNSNIGNFTESSFESKIDFYTGQINNPISIAIGDLDNDNKKDIVIGKAGSSLSILKNTSSVGNISNTSFAPKIDLPILSSAYGVAIEDIDGDGKPEIIATNYFSDSISVFRNISTVGNIAINSFANKVNFKTGSSPRDLSVADIDGDGKKDILVINLIGNTISILRNISTIGNIAFSVKTDIGSLNNPRSITTSDINEDGKKDLVVSNYWGNNISIFRNNSTQGVISFGQFNLPTNLGPIGVEISDIDGDEKKDILVTGNNGSFLSYYRNIDTTGLISGSSFGSKVDFVSGSNPYGVASDDLNGDLKNDVVTTNSAGNISIFKNLNPSYILVGIDSNGCTARKSIKVTVNPKPTAGFTINNPTQCINGNSFSFADTSIIGIGSITRLWDLASGDTSTNIFKNKVFNNPGNYNIKLVLTNSNGCKDSIIKTITVNPKPTVGFAINIPNQCINGNSFSFTDTSIIESGTFARLWNLGGGDTSTSVLKNKVFSNPGSYNIKLVLTSNNGCKDSLIKTITINPKPIVGFIINNPTQCINGNSFSFTDTSLIGSGTFSRYWNLGNGDTSSNIFKNKVFNNPGSYNIKLVLTSNNGCKDSLTKPITVNPKPVSTATAFGPTTFCEGNGVLLNANTGDSLIYLWKKNGINLVNGNSASYNATLSGTYRVFVTNTYNCVDSSNSVNITVNPNPIAAFRINKTEQCFRGNEFIFTDSSQIISGNINQHWDFGDSYSDTSKTAHHSYLTEGAYVVKLTSTSIFSCSDTAITNVIINSHPKSGFTISSPSQQCLRFNRFEFNDTTNINSGSYNILWKFGDDSSQMIGTPSHHYKVAGNYNVLLIITNNKACIDSTSKNITVNPHPGAFIFEPTTNQFCVNDSLQLEANTGDKFSYQWIKNDTSIIALNQSKTYINEAGNYKVIVTNDFQCIDTSNTFIANINPLPIIGNVLGPQTINNISTPVNYNISQKLNHQYLWTVTGGNIVSGQGTNNISVQWASAGIGRVMIKLTNANNCSDTSGVNVNISSTGLDNFWNINSISIYPNPFNDKLIVSTQNYAPLSFYLYDVQGRLILEKEINEKTEIINLNHLSSGVYLAIIKNGQLTSTYRIVKN